jgi:hypothetical protein
MTSEGISSVLCLADVDRNALRELLGRYSIELVMLPAGTAITGSFWGEPEAGVLDCRVFARADTPLHSVLHEACHIVCMNNARRQALDTDAGGDDLEESAVCYLQVLLAAKLPGVGTTRLMRDMDAWGYSFRLGSTARWFDEDAGDAVDWLAGHGLLDRRREPVFCLRHN